MKETQYNDLFSLEKNEQIKEFCISVKKIKPKDVLYYLEESRRNVKVCLLLKNYYEFIIDNNSQKPDLNSRNKKEKILALLYKKYVEKGLIEDVSDQIVTDNAYRLKLQGEVLKKVLDNKYQNALIKNIIIKRVGFLYNHKRKPLLNSQNPQERFLAEQFNEKCMKNLSDADITELNKLFNSSQYLTNTAIQYAKNKKMEEMVNEQ